MKGKVIMKNKMLIFVSLAVIAALAAVNHNLAKAAPEPAVKKSTFGVVSIRVIFENSKRNADYRTAATAEQNKIIDQLEKISKEIEAEQAGLKTLKLDSPEYSQSSKNLLEKQAYLQAQQDFYKRDLEYKDQMWTEKLYLDILKYTEVVAKDNGLEIVFEEDQVQLPAVSPNDLMLTIRTHKLLYSAGCMDITNMVLAKIDGVTVPTVPSK